MSAAAEPDVRMSATLSPLQAKPTKLPVPPSKITGGTGFAAPGAQLSFTDRQMG